MWVLLILFLVGTGLGRGILRLVMGILLIIVAGGIVSS